MTASAQWTGSVAALSDYRHRGVSLSDRQPAVQASVAYDHRSGVFAGALGTSTRIGTSHEEIGFQALLYGGYARRASSRLSWEVGALRYAYPESRSAREYDYSEIFVGLASGGASARVFHSPDYLGFRERSWYLQGAYVQPLRGSMNLYAQLGVMWRSPSDLGMPALDFPRRTDARFGGQYVWRGFQFDLGLVASDIPDDRCPGGARQCRLGLVLGVTYLLP